MNNVKFIAPLFVLLFLFTGMATVDAQKFGHVNANLLLSQIPETSEADQALKAYRKELSNKGEIMASALQIKYEGFYEKANGGELTRIQMQEMEEKLNAERDELLAYEQEMQRKIAKKREELYGPILAKVQQAIDEVGAENGFQFIFDSSVGMNTIVFADDSVDVMSLVKSKLGME